MLFLINFIITFLIVFILYYLFSVRNVIKDIAKMTVETKYLMYKYNINSEIVCSKKFQLLLDFLISVNISLITTVIMCIDNIFVKILLGILIIPLMLYSFRIFGNKYGNDEKLENSIKKEKGEKKNDNKRNRK